MMMQQTVRLSTAYIGKKKQCTADMCCNPQYKQMHTGFVAPCACTPTTCVRISSSTMRYCCFVVRCLLCYGSVMVALLYNSIHGSTHNSTNKQMTTSRRPHCMHVRRVCYCLKLLLSVVDNTSVMIDRRVCACVSVCVCKRWGALMC
jgi:hypothetical protein